MNRLQTDRQLAIELRKGSVAAFDSLYKKYAPRLFRFAVSLLKNEEDAQEVLQEVFLIIWKKRFEVNYELSIQSFLFTVSYNIIIDALRSKVKTKAFVSELYSQFHRSELQQELEYRQLNERLKTAVDALPTQRRLIFQLSREEGLSHREVAERLNIAPKTVENQINLALKQIRKKLRSDDLLAILFIYLFL